MEPSGMMRAKAAVGATLGFELGSTFYWGPFGLDIRYKFSKSGNMTGDLIFNEDYEDNSFGTHGPDAGNRICVFKPVTYHSM